MLCDHCRLLAALSRLFCTELDHSREVAALNMLCDHCKEVAALSSLFTHAL